MKLTPFLIADNPMMGTSASAIIHTEDPKAIIEIIEGHTQENSPFRHFSLINSDGLPELYTLRVHHLFTTEFDAEKHHLMTDNLLDKAWKWFVSYLNWEDQQINLAE